MFPSALKCLQWSAPHGKSVSVGLIKRVAQQLLASTLAASASLFPLVRKRSSVWQRAVSSPHLNPPPFSLIRVFSFQLPRWLPVVIFPPVLLTVVPPPPLLLRACLIPSVQPSQPRRCLKSIASGYCGGAEVSESTPAHQWGALAQLLR